MAEPRVTRRPASCSRCSPFRRECGNRPGKGQRPAPCGVSGAILPHPLHRDSRCNRMKNDPSQRRSCVESFALPGQDSNLDKENQNLLCYRYTTG